MPPKLPISSSVLMAPLVAASLIVAGCDGSENQDSTGPAVTPSKYATSVARPTPLAPVAFHSNSTRIGVGSVDEVLAAVEARDANALASLLSEEGVPCVINASGVAAPPTCPPGQATGALVSVIPFPVCEGRYVDSAEAVRTMQELIFPRSPRLFAVYTPNRDVFGRTTRPEMLVSFGFEGPQPAGEWEVWLRSGRISGMSFCEYALPEVVSPTAVSLAPR
jgi:hypothetical protein